MQLFFLHFKFKCPAWFSHHHDKSPPFQSRNNHVLARHLPTITAMVNSTQLHRGGTRVGWEPHTGRTPALHTCPTHTPAPRPQSPCNQLHGAPAGMATLQPGSHGWEQHKPPRFLFSTKASSHPTLLGVMGSISNIPFLLEDCYVSLLKELKLLKPLLNFQ